MRVKLMIAVGAIMVAQPALAQNSVAAAGNNVAESAAQKTDAAKPKKAAKPAGDKICRRLSQGKVCMTAEQWKAYNEIM